MDGSTRIKFTLGIGFQSDQEDVFDLEGLIENWAELSQEDLEEALYNEWKKWIWEFIDGGWEIAKGEEAND
ncbi:MAG: hypothetical protein ACK5X3_12685 [Pseudomonadota bacterium]|jgi:hypothetical protein